MTKGIRRIRSGRGFRYVFPNGKPITPKNPAFSRIKSLAIPPAWTDVWISPSASAGLQATGFDARGRKQYRYHDSFRARRENEKFRHLIPFAKVLPRIRVRVERDLRDWRLSREKVLATVVRLLDTTLIRVGNAEYARNNESYGLTTLRNNHVRIIGSVMKFSFRGKSGRSHFIALRDRRIAKILKECQRLPEPELLEYIDEKEIRHDIHSRDVNEYLRSISGGEFTAKDFRTWHGTVLAVTALSELPPGKGRRRVKRVVEAVSGLLGNTPAVCRKSYIHPSVLRVAELGLPLPAASRSPAGLSLRERKAFALLSRKWSRPLTQKSEGPRTPKSS